MDTESGVDPAEQPRRRSTSRSTISRKSSEDSDSNESSIDKETSAKDSELHNGGVCDAEELPKESNETTTEVSGVNTKGDEKQGNRSLRVGDKWKLHLDLSDSCSQSENEESEVDDPTVSSTIPAGHSQDEEPQATDADIGADIGPDDGGDEATRDDASISSDTSDFLGFEDVSCDQEYIKALVEVIHTCETTEDDCFSDAKNHSADAHIQAESENEKVRSHMPDDDSNSSGLVSQDTGKSVVQSPASTLSNKTKIKIKFSNSPVPSSSKSGSTKKMSIDITNPAFRKPFELGWKREVVFRNTGDPNNIRRMCDIYYFTPTGKKVRSTRELLENLAGSTLTLDNFTFFKEPFGLNDPEKEIIRDARRISLPVKDSVSPTTAVPAGSAKRVPKLKPPPADLLPAADQPSTSGVSSVKQEPLTRTEEETSETSSSSGISREPAVTPTATPASTSSAVSPHKVPPAVAGPSGINKGKNRSQPYATMTRSFPRIKVTSPRAARGGRLQFSPRGKIALSPPSGADGNMEIGMLPPMWKDKDGASTTKVLSSPGAAQNLQMVSPKGSGKTARGGKTGDQAAWVQTGLSATTCTITTGVTTTTAVTVTAGGSVLVPIPKKFGVCTIQCPGLLGTVPSLQCRICLCLYHPECMGLGSLSSTIRNYICKNCQYEKDTMPASTSTTVGPPPLAPLTPMVSTDGPKTNQNKSADSIIVKAIPLSENPVANATANKLKQFPKPGVKTTLTVATSATASTLTTNMSTSTNTTGTMTNMTTKTPSAASTKLVMMPTFLKLDQANQSTQTLTNAVTTVSIVGSVTTWLPPSSQIHVSGPGGDLGPSLTTMSSFVATPHGYPSPSAPASQSLVRAGGKRYIVMPKHNVLSVTPAGAALTPRPLAIDGGVSSGSVPPCDIKQSIPTPTQATYLIGAQNPPGVLLVPVLGPSGSSGPGTGASLAASHEKPQILLVNGTSGGTPGGFVLSATAATGMDAASESRKRKAVPSSPEEAAGATKKSRTVDSVNGDIASLHTFMSRYMYNVSETYNVMLRVFEHLKVQELLCAARVNRLWRSIAMHESLWKSVRLKNSHVADWKGCVEALARRGTRHLDMRKMLVPAGRAEDWWADFYANIGLLTSLTSVELCRCHAAAVERVAQQCPQLTSLSALSIKDQSINLSSVRQLKNLQELRIRNLSGLYLNGNLDSLKELSCLKHLSLTMVKNLGHVGCGVLGSLQSLESLELGECCDLPPTFGTQTLPQLHSLQRLRLEKGQGDACPTFALLAGVRALPSLVTLELVNFDIKAGFDAALARCQNVRRLLIIPTYISQSATTNHMVLDGVTKLGDSLTHFVWGVTHELLRVTELFVDQIEDQKVPSGNQIGKEKDKKKSSTPPAPGVGVVDSIPVLRPVSGTIPSDDGMDKSAESKSQGQQSSTSNSSPAQSSASTPGAPQVDILPLTKLQKMLTTALPNTKVKILKVAFQATWRQYISETDF